MRIVISIIAIFFIQSTMSQSLSQFTENVPEISVDSICKMSARELEGKTYKVTGIIHSRISVGGVMFARLYSTCSDECIWITTDKTSLPGRENEKVTITLDFVREQSFWVSVYIFNERQ